MGFPEFPHLFIRGADFAQFNLILDLKDWASKTRTRTESTYQGVSVKEVNVSFIISLPYHHILDCDLLFLGLINTS